jgi:hypothetical protein
MWIDYLGDISEVGRMNELVNEHGTVHTAPYTVAIHSELQRWRVAAKAATI